MCKEKRCCGMERDVRREEKKRNCSTENSPFYPCISYNPTASAALRKREKMFLPLFPLLSPVLLLYSRSDENNAPSIDKFHIPANFARPSFKSPYPFTAALK